MCELGVCYCVSVRASGVLELWDCEHLILKFVGWY